MLYIALNDTATSEANGGQAVLVRPTARIWDKNTKQATDLEKLT